MSQAPPPKIIHISDLHLGHADCAERMDTIIDRIRAAAVDPAEHVVVITGDLTDNAFNDNAWAEPLRWIRELEGLGFRVLVVPGNHDYGREVIMHCSFIEPFKQTFYQGFDQGEGTWIVEDGRVTKAAALSQLTYPMLNIIGGAAFISLDTQEGEFENLLDPFSSDGELGEAQLNRLDIMMNAPMLDLPDIKTVVLMHHHPLVHLPLHNLKDAGRLRPIIEGRVDALLFGHNHLITGDDWKQFRGSWEIPRCYDVGTSTHKSGFPGYILYIDLERDVSSDRILLQRPGSSPMDS